MSENDGVFQKIGTWVKKKREEAAAKSAERERKVREERESLIRPHLNPDEQLLSSFIFLNEMSRGMKAAKFANKFVPMGSTLAQGAFGHLEQYYLDVLTDKRVLLLQLERKEIG